MWLKLFAGVITLYSLTQLCEITQQFIYLLRNVSCTVRVGTWKPTLHIASSSRQACVPRPISVAFVINHCNIQVLLRYCTVVYLLPLS
jgi:hypothetical protein